MARLTTIDTGIPLPSSIVHRPHMSMKNAAPPEVESFRLAPIASTNVPQYQLQVQQSANAEVSEGLLNISKQVIFLEKSVSSPAAPRAHGTQGVLGYVGSLRAAGEPVVVRNSPRANTKQQRAKGPKPKVASSAFTFVSMTTSDGKRDWPAEAQIRSHAARQVQARKRHERERNSQGLPMPICNHSTPLEMPNPARDLLETFVPGRQVPELALAPHLDVQVQRGREHRDDSSSELPPGSKIFAHLRCGECDGMEVFHEYNGSVNVHYSLGALSHPFGQSLFDPFAQMAEPITHRMHELLSHWVFEHSPRVVPKIYGRNNISRLGVEHELKDAMEDDVACHVISAAAGFQQAELILKTDSSLDSAAVARSRLRHEEALTHLQRGMQKLNLRFKDHTQTLTPNTIMDVARLALATAFAGDVRAHKAHHDGFVKLVELRGGIDTIPRDKAHHISRIESNSAWTDKVAPKMPMYKSEARILHPAIGSPFPNRELQDFLWEPLWAAAMDLQSMSYLLDERLGSGEDKPLSREKTEWNEDAFAATQHRLVSFPHPEQQMVKSVMYFRQNCWRCAAFIYLNFVVREAPAGAIVKFAVVRLIDSLQNSEPWTGWASNSNILLWVLLMGIIGASSDAEKGLFQLEFRRLLRQLGLFTAEEVRNVLRMQVWRDLPLVGHLKRLL